MSSVPIVQPLVTCQIGQDDTIMSINDEWRRFAKENGMPALAQEVNRLTLVEVHHRQLGRSPVRPTSGESA